MSLNRFRPASMRFVTAWSGLSCSLLCIYLGGRAELAEQAHVKLVAALVSSRYIYIRKTYARCVHLDLNHCH